MRGAFRTYLLRSGNTGGCKYLHPPVLPLRSSVASVYGLGVIVGVTVASGVGVGVPMLTEYRTALRTTARSFSLTLNSILFWTMYRKPPRAIIVAL